MTSNAALHEAEHARDPVCGMQVVIAGAQHTTTHEEETHFFCCAGCMHKFDADPQRYLNPTPAEPAQAVPGARYTCPMDPEIIRDEPGPCPVCGMALETMGISLTSGPNPELVDMRRRFLVSLLFAVPLLVIEMAKHLFTIDVLGMLGVRAGAAPWVAFALATPVVLWCGWPILCRGAASLVTRNLNMFTLIAIGTLAAYGYSVATLAAPAFFASSTMSAMPGAHYFESAAVIISLVLLGQMLELIARERSGDALRALLALAPETAERIGDDGHVLRVPLEELCIGDQLRVKPGERVALDGVIVQGSGLVDESALTGEAVPVQKVEGHNVTGGTINNSGSFVMRVTRTSADTVLAQIVALVAETQRSKAPIQRLADQVASYFVPTVIAIAVVAFVCWLIFAPAFGVSSALLAAVSVLIIACPCALGLATPMSIIVASGRGAGDGVVLRDAAALETFAKADVLVLDKTGTLTEGKPKLREISVAQGFAADEVLAWSASIEQVSEQPLGEAVVRAAHERGLALLPANECETLVGLGVRGRVQEHRLAIGSSHFMASEGCDVAAFDGQANAARARGDTVIFVAVDAKLCAVMAFGDRVKEDALRSMDALRRSGLDVVMATGDHLVNARYIASELGITEVHAEQMPQAKAALIKRLQGAGRIVAMAGDGVNDAPALAQADVGIAFARGADVAVESAGFTLMGDALTGLARSRELSVATLKNIKQNLFFAFIYNSVGVPVAAGVLYPWLGILLSPMVAAAAMSLSSLCVIANALRLRTSTEG